MKSLRNPIVSTFPREFKQKPASKSLNMVEFGYYSINNRYSMDSMDFFLPIKYLFSSDTVNIIKNLNSDDPCTKKVSFVFLNCQLAHLESLVDENAIANQDDKDRIVIVCKKIQEEIENEKKEKHGCLYSTAQKVSALLDSIFFFSSHKSGQTGADRANELAKSIEKKLSPFLSETLKEMEPLKSNNGQSVNQKKLSSKSQESKTPSESKTQAIGLNSSIEEFSIDSSSNAGSETTLFEPKVAEIKPIAKTQNKAAAPALKSILKTKSPLPGTYQKNLTFKIDGENKRDRGVFQDELEESVEKQCKEEYKLPIKVMNGHLVEFSRLKNTYPILKKALDDPNIRERVISPQEKSQDEEIKLRKNNILGVYSKKEVFKDLKKLLDETIKENKHRKRSDINRAVNGAFEDFFTKTTSVTKQEILHALIGGFEREPIYARRFVELLHKVCQDAGTPLDLNAKDQHGLTPLMLSVISGNESVVELLVHLGADRELKDKNGCNAIEMANQQKQQILMQIKDEASEIITKTNDPKLGAKLNLGGGLVEKIGPLQAKRLSGLRDEDFYAAYSVVEGLRTPFLRVSELLEQYETYEGIIRDLEGKKKSNRIQFNPQYKEKFFDKGMSIAESEGEWNWAVNRKRYSVSEGEKNIERGPIKIHPLKE